MNDDQMAERLFGAPPPPENQTLINGMFIAPTPAPKPDTRSAADRMFGGTMAPSEQAPAVADEQRAHRTDEQIAEDLYGEKADELPDIELPPGVKELREADQARQIFSPQVTYRDAYTEAMLDETEEIQGAPAAMRTAILNEAREVAADVGLSLSDISTLRDVDRAIKANPPTDEMRADWREEAIARMNQEFGNGADQAMRDTRAFIAKDPRFAYVLEIDGRGDHPETVMLFARLARRARMEGRLK